MIEILPESTGKVLAVKATEKLTDSDYKEVWIPALEKLINEVGKINALLCLGENFQGWEPKAMWDDAQFALKHRKDFARMARSVALNGWLGAQNSVNCSWKNVKSKRLQLRMHKRLLTGSWAKAFFSTGNIRLCEQYLF